ncbi:DEAD/DEAH box helicase [Eubacteriales bacterium OttesenSCG-928-N13]|nr:DEAD/DEAH box helicase [Eubacteriales bacterium OttesenSCG-928-N13]
MNLIAPLLSAVKKNGYDTPTPIQQATIPLVLAGKDVLGCAQTGTGKTAAFALPMLQRLSQIKRPMNARGRRAISALVLTPTRELAQQIYENFLSYGEKLGLNACVIFGGVGQKPQTDALERGVDILVATPGRLNDLIGQGYIDLSLLSIFVLDEADRMLDMGFIHDVRRVLRYLPDVRQTLFFSATMPKEVESLAMSILHNPETVKVDPPTSTVDSIVQSLYMIDRPNKKKLLAQLIQRAPKEDNFLVFVRTKHGADRVVRELKKEGIEARAIHGDKSQNARQEALNQFKSGQVRVLIATDIAARGIDIQGLSHVVNNDLPNEPEAYIHRIGRTGRAGMEGDAISFCCIDEMKQLSQIERLIDKQIPRLESEWPMEVFTPSEPVVRGPRPSKLGMDGQPLRTQQGGRRNQGAPSRDRNKQGDSSGDRNKQGSSSGDRRPQGGSSYGSDGRRSSGGEGGRSRSGSRRRSGGSGGRGRG